MCSRFRYQRRHACRLCQPIGIISPHSDKIWVGLAYFVRLRQIASNHYRLRLSQSKLERGRKRQQLKYLSFFLHFGVILPSQWQYIPVFYGSHLCFRCPSRSGQGPDFYEHISHFVSEKTRCHIFLYLLTRGHIRVPDSVTS